MLIAENVQVHKRPKCLKIRRPPQNFMRQNGDINKFYTKNTHLSGANLQNLVATASWPPEFVHPCSNYLLHRTLTKELPSFFFFIFFFSPPPPPHPPCRWTLAYYKIVLHSSRSRDLSFQFLIPIFFKPVSTFKLIYFETYFTRDRYIFKTN
jgi:hypothetical protein